MPEGPHHGMTRRDVLKAGAAVAGTGDSPGSTRDGCSRQFRSGTLLECCFQRIVGGQPNLTDCLGTLWSGQFASVDTLLQAI